MSFTKEYLAGRPDLVRRVFELAGVDFANARRNGKELTIPCPFHDDEHPSLDINISIAKYVCRACGAGGDAIRFFALRNRQTDGEAIAELRGRLSLNGAFAGATSEYGRIVATYDYRDEHGKLLYQTVRFEPKDFSQRRPDGKGGWIRHLDCPTDPKKQTEDCRQKRHEAVVRRVLYHLPELLKADPDAIVWKPAGEKDVDNLVSLGEIATTNSGGEGKGKWKAEYAKPFRGHHVVILPHNDAVGAEHGEEVARSLYGVAASVRVVDLPGLPEKGDVSDFLAAGHTIEELRQLAAATPEWNPPAAEFDAASWPEPIAFDSPARLPEFPMEALPAPIADFSDLVAESRQVPRDLSALIVLGVLSAAAAGRFRVRVKADYSEPVNLFVAPALPSGERKSATFRDCTAPLAEFELELQALKGPAIATTREQRKLEEARLEHLRRQAAKADDPEELCAEARELAARLTEVPAEPLLMVGDVTPEKLGSTLAEQGGRIALVDAEAGGVFEILRGRYSGNGRANFDVFLRGHAGDDLRVHRMGRSEIVRHPALTVVLSPQPSVLCDLADEPQFRGRGLLARFLYALPQSRVGSRRFVQTADRPEVRAAYRSAIWSILSVEPPERGEPGHILRLSTAALDIWAHYHDETEGRQREDGDLRGIRDWASKSTGAALRIAGLLHLASGLRQDRPITDETMAAAWAIVRDYLTPHALEAFAMIGTDRKVEQARKIAGWIARTGRERLTRRDAYKNFTAFGEPADFDAPLRILENRSIIRAAAPEDRGGPGRKPSPAYEVNPRFLGPSSDFRSPELPSESTKSPPTSNSVYSDGTSLVSKSEIRLPEASSPEDFEEEF